MRTCVHRRTGTVGPGGADTLLPEKEKWHGLKAGKEAYKMNNKTYNEIIVYKPCLLS